MIRSITILLILNYSIATARFIESWDYEKLRDKSDLVIIAVPMSATKTAEAERMPNKDIVCDVVLSPLSVQTVLKGKIQAGETILRYLQVPANLPRDKMMTHIYINGPNLVSFDIASKSCYLMFLKRLDSGQYISITGQLDPAFGIKMLAGYPGAKIEEQNKAEMATPRKPSD